MLPEARAFLLANARILDRHLFAFHFEAADPAPVLRALDAYRAGGGLYAHGLEPDKRSPVPQPVDQEIALGVLDEVGAAPERFREIAEGLDRLILPGGGLSFSHPSVSEGPLAAWWACAPGPQPFSINPTGAILAILLRRSVEARWMARAEELCWAALDALTPAQPHSLVNALAFLAAAPDRARAAAEFGAVAEKVRDAATFDPEADGYVFTPLTFAPCPESPAARIFSAAELSPHLAALVGRQEGDGGWPINWPAMSAGVEAEARGRVTLRALRTLRAYGMLPGG